MCGLPSSEVLVRSEVAERLGNFAGALSESGSLDVETVSLDELVDAGTLPRPNYLKIDVEGAEFRVLRGARKILDEGGPAIFLAVHTREAETLCRDALTALRYAMRPITSDAWLCLPPGDYAEDAVGAYGRVSVNATISRMCPGQTSARLSRGAAGSRSRR